MVSVAPVVHVHTGPVIDYTQAWTDAKRSSSLVFGCQACSSARVVLASSPGLVFSGAYEISIGGKDNSKTALRDVVFGNVIAEVDTPGILSCGSIRYFWTAWGESVRFGTGHLIGANMVLDVVPEKRHSVKALGVTTAMGEEGHWEFTEVNGGNFHTFNISIKCIWQHLVKFTLEE